MCWIFSDKTEATAKTFFIKYLTKLRMNVKNLMLHYWFPEDAKVKFSEIIILWWSCAFFREAIFVPYLDHLIVEMENRFFDQKLKCRSLWGLIPKYCDASPNTAQDLERLLAIYQEDNGSRAAVVPEVQRWENKWKNEDVSTVPSRAAFCILRITSWSRRTAHREEQDREFMLINPRQSSNVLNVHGPHSTQNPQLSAVRTISIRGPHLARGPQFAHPCCKTIE